MITRILSVILANEHDVVLARQRAREIAELFGFERQDQTRIATAVSEIARNAVQYAGKGQIEFGIDRTDPAALMITVSDRGSGIARLDEVLDGHYSSATGMGIGMVGARRLMDRFQVDSSAGGTTVAMNKHLPREVTTADLRKATDRLAAGIAEDPAAEVQRQNHELLAAFQDLQSRMDDVERLNQELDETNRGVLALYAELDEKAEALRRASELKSRFLSNISHEFRTPLNSILSLSRLLLERLDGELTAEQDRQVTFIRRSAEGLSELVNDLLDLAKIEAGKVALRPSPLKINDLFAALRGMFRPLVHSDTVVLQFYEAPGLPVLWIDESKLSQILRNLVSNALKFTERGQVQVSAERAQDGSLVFAVADSGIGIAPADQVRIFEEFAQVEGPHQRRYKGTGLGLPLSRRLAELLGGDITVESQPGVGSTFRVTVPERCPGSEPDDAGVSGTGGAASQPLLVVSSHPNALAEHRQRMEQEGVSTHVVSSGEDVPRLLRALCPAVVVLQDLTTPSLTSLLRALRENEFSRDAPVVVVGAPEQRGIALTAGAEMYATSPIDAETFSAILLPLLASRKRPQVLVVDDDEVSRYVLRGHLAGSGYVITEASSGIAGLKQIEQARPDLVFLDLVMPGLTGFDVLAELRADPEKRSIPVIVVTSKQLEPAERRYLQSHAMDVLSKQDLSREQTLAAAASALRGVRSQG